MKRLTLCGIIGVLLMIGVRGAVIAESAHAIYNTIVSEIVLEVVTDEDGLRVIDCQVEIKDFD